MPNDDDLLFKMRREQLNLENQYDSDMRELNRREEYLADFMGRAKQTHLEMTNNIQENLQGPEGEMFLQGLADEQFNIGRTVNQEMDELEIDKKNLRINLDKDNEEIMTKYRGK